MKLVSLILPFLVSNLLIVAEGKKKQSCIKSSLQKVKGIYPVRSIVDEPDPSDVTKWSTASIVNLDGLAHEWDPRNQDTYRKGELTIKPAAPGFENRVVLHFVSDLTNPFGVYYPKDLDVYLDPQAREVMEKGPFNCHISRSIKVQRKLMNKYLDDCPPKLTPYECIKRAGLYENIQCVAGTINPICCYTKFFSNPDSDPILLSRSLRYFESAHNNTIRDLRKCRAFQKEPSLSEIEKQCPNNIKDEMERQLFYIFNKNVTCNPFFASTRNGCTVKKTLSRYSTPCFGVCLTAMMVRVNGCFPE